MPKSKREKPWISLAKITVDSGLTPEAFTDCLLEAWTKGEAKKGGLRIEKRSGSDIEPMFLFMIDDKILGQFLLDTSFLEKPMTIQHTIEYTLEHLEKKGKHYVYKKKKGRF